jgi:crossover junction endodeoxyribonuclease RuvC
MYCIGIDPGFSGAVAVIGDGEIRIYDAPIAKVKSGRKTHSEMIPQMMVNILKTYVFRETHVFIEKVGVMPGQGIASSGAFMRGYGMWEGVVAALGLPYTLVHPARWKKAMMGDMGKDKDAARLRAAQLFPAAAEGLSRVKDDGRAEALLLAEYGRRTIS